MVPPPNQARGWVYVAATALLIAAGIGGLKALQLVVPPATKPSAAEARDRALLGLTVREAIDRTKMQLDAQFIYESPPGVAVAVRGKVPDTNDRLWLTFDEPVRREPPGGRGRAWDLRTFEGRKVIGVARESLKDGTHYTVGDSVRPPRADTPPK